MGQLLRALSDRLALPCAQGLGPFLVPPQLPLQGPAKAQHGHGPPGLLCVPLASALGLHTRGCKV